MASFLRSLAGGAMRASQVLPRRAVEDFWKGGSRDPTINSAKKQLNMVSGEAWPAVLLRMKSFSDMHKLWYVCLKEKNFLMAEQYEAKQQGVKWKSHGRLKKVKLSMKRILTVLTRREIHQQALRAKDILAKQTEREELETQRFHLEEQMKVLQHKVRRAGPQDSLAISAWKATLQKFEADHARLLSDLAPLRKDTMQMLSADWRYSRRMSDLPGQIRWRKEWVRALDERMWKPLRSA